MNMVLEKGVGGVLVQGKGTRQDLTGTAKPGQMKSEHLVQGR